MLNVNHRWIFCPLMAGRVITSKDAQKGYDAVQIRFDDVDQTITDNKNYIRLSVFHTLKLHQ